MADSAVSIADSTGTARTIDAALVGTDFQQTVTVGDGTNAGRYAAVDAAGRIATRATVGASTTATLTTVSGNTTTAVLLAANTARLGVAVYNDSTAILYLAFAATASTSAYTVQIAGGGYYETQPGVIYTGVISGIWATATGAARITELS